MITPGMTRWGIKRQAVVTQQTAHSEHSGHAVPHSSCYTLTDFSDLPSYMSSQGQHRFSGLANHPDGIINLVHSKLSEVFVE